jgi:hypothetical protein
MGRTIHHCHHNRTPATSANPGTAIPNQIFVRFRFNRGKLEETAGNAKSTEKIGRRYGRLHREFIHTMRRDIARERVGVTVFALSAFPAVT